MIKAIETEYKGYKFRSRLEARWAIFFDVLNIKWEYEPEGYQTSKGWYLPDFYLPESETFAEVKPDNGDFTKAIFLAKEKPAKVWFCEGVPDFNFYFSNFTKDDGVISDVWLCGAWRKHFVADRKEIPLICTECIRSSAKFKNSYGAYCFYYGNGQPPHPNSINPYFFSKAYHLAVKSAKQARFEHNKL